MTKSNKKPEHYVNNKDFLNAMTEWKKECGKAKRKGTIEPPVTNYIGECFLKIANHLSYRPNFINYTFRDEMISDGIENCLQYLRNFDPKKSQNPFAYFTQIIYYAFIRRIQKEKKQSEIKSRIIDEANLDDLVLQPGDQGEFNNQFLDYLKKNKPIIEPSPKKKKTRKTKSKTEKLFS